MISTLTAAGTPARNAVPVSTGPLTTGPASTGPASTGPLTTAAGRQARGRRNLGPVSTGPAGTGTAAALPMPSRVPGAALSLLRTARQGLAEAEAEGDPATRYIGAHLAALRAAAAIVAARGEPGTGARRRRPRSVWELLPQVRRPSPSGRRSSRRARPSGPQRRRDFRGRRPRARRTTCCATRVRSSRSPSGRSGLRANRCCRCHCGTRADAPERDRPTRRSPGSRRMGHGSSTLWGVAAPPRGQKRPDPVG